MKALLRNTRHAATATSREPATTPRPEQRPVAPPAGQAWEQRWEKRVMPR